MSDVEQVGPSNPDDVPNVAGSSNLVPHQVFSRKRAEKEGGKSRTMDSPDTPVASTSEETQVPMTVSREEHDAKIALSEARTETKFAELRGEIAVISSSLAKIGGDVNAQRSEASSNRNTVVVTTIGTGIAIIGAIVALLSYGASNWYNGTVMRDAVKAEVSDRMTSPAAEPKK